MENFLVSSFLKILNMSMTASYIIIAVIIARFLLGKAPKKYSYALWTAAAFRLVCPVSFKSVISIFSLKPFNIPVEDVNAGSQAGEIVHFPENFEYMAQPEIQTGIPALDPVVNGSLPAATPMTSANPIQIWEFVGAIVWVIGIVILLAVSLVSLLRLCSRLKTATVLNGNVRQSENVRSPFIIGLFNPIIYIPYGVEEPALTYVLAHERAHIKRGDHIIRILSWLVLCLHWFNPLAWLAFYLMGRDMELSCDEKVLAKMRDRAGYSETLLSFSCRRRFPAPTPLAFGESSVGRRIKNALKWKRPRLWVSTAALVLCIAVIAVCAANPQKKDDEGWELSGRWVPVECVYKSGVYSWYPYGGDNGNVYEFFEDENRFVRAYDHISGSPLGGYTIAGEWQEFPYSDEEWAEMFIMYEFEPLREMYDEILYLGPSPDLNLLPFEELDELESFRQQNSFFMKVDGELWYVSTTKDSNIKRWISSIFALKKEETLGKASFVYPDGTSNEPGMSIEFSDGVESVYAFCTNGSMAMYVRDELFAWADGSINVSGVDSIFWTPVQQGNDYQRPEPYGLAESDLIHLVVHFDDQSSIMCSIYADYAEGVYTLRPVGRGVYLEQKGEGEALLSFDRSYAHPNSPNAEDPAEITAGSPFELLTGLIFNSESTYKLAGGGFDHSDIAKQQINSILEALALLSPDELKVGRGMPYTGSLGFQIPSGDHVILGYCGDFVELQLSEPLRELYPADGGVWEIHNAALTELLTEMIALDEDYSILRGEAENVTGMELILPERSIVLGEELVELAMGLFSRGKSSAEVYATDIEDVKNISYALKVKYADGSSELLFIDTQEDSFRRYTQSDDGMLNSVRVTLFCPELWTLLKEQAGLVEKEDLPGLSIGFVNNSDAEANKLEVCLGSADALGYSAISTITRGGYTSSASIKPMEKGEEYFSNFSAESLGVVAEFELIRIDFLLDGTKIGSYTFERSKIWGGYLSCELRSDGVFTVLAHGPNSISFAYDADKNNALQLDFGKWDSLELTYDGGAMMFTSDGIGWGDFTGNRVFFENEDIFWSPMEPVDDEDENVLAKRADSAAVVFSVSENGTTFGGALSIEGIDGLYTVSAMDEAINLGLGSDGRVVVIWDDRFRGGIEMLS